MPWPFCPATRDQILGAVSFEKEGISPLLQSGAGHHWIRRSLVPLDQVFVLRERRPLFGRPGIADARVESGGGLRPEWARAGEARAGVDRILASRSRRPKGDRKILPIHEVAASRVSPILHSSPIVVGSELIEDVIPAVVKNRTVGVVHPIAGISVVKGGTVWIGCRNRHRGSNIRFSLRDDVVPFLIDMDAGPGAALRMKGKGGEEDADHNSDLATQTQARRRARRDAWGEVRRQPNLGTNSHRQDIVQPNF